MFDKRIKLTIREVYYKDAHAKGIEIAGPTSAVVVEVFLAIFDAMGAQAIEGVDGPAVQYHPRIPDNLG